MTPEFKLTTDELIRRESRANSSAHPHEFDASPNKITPNIFGSFAGGPTNALLVGSSGSNNDKGSNIKRRSTLLRAFTV